MKQAVHMKYSILLLLILTSQIQAANWPLEDINDTLIMRGTAKTAAGASGQSLVLDGESLIELKDSADLASDAFTVSLWFNPYDLAGEQQMLVGKNRYSRNERQWSLTIEPDGKLKAHLRQNGWSTISCDEPLVAGKWHLATLVADSGKATLFLNGNPVGEVKLQTPIAATPAPITLGGIWDRETLRQAFHGAVDEFSLQPRALTAQEIGASYRPVSTTHEVPRLTARWPLWDDSQKLPKAAELPQVAGAEFHVIKKQRPDTDGCNWTLGVGLAWHKGKLYASYGYNKGAENTPTEEAHVRVSDDGGKTWGPTVVMDAGEGNLGVSHGVFLSHHGKLWAFMGGFYANDQPYYRVHTRAYLLNERYRRMGDARSVVDDGFWPMQEPQKMADGNWIMAGFRIGGNGELATCPRWPSARAMTSPNGTWSSFLPRPVWAIIWGESTVIVEDKRILNISRYGKKALALLSISEDHGRTWTPTAPSNLPMATSKPYAGTLSTGQPYLVCTTTADTGGARSPSDHRREQTGRIGFQQGLRHPHVGLRGHAGSLRPESRLQLPLRRRARRQALHRLHSQKPRGERTGRHPHRSIARRTPFSVASRADKRHRSCRDEGSRRSGAGTEISVMGRRADTCATGMGENVAVTTGRLLLADSQA